MGVVLDTSALVDIERRGADLLAALGAVANEPVVVPAIVYAELLVGVAMANTKTRAAQRRMQIDALVARVPIVEFDRAIAERWADLFAESSRRGAPLPANDLAVAATARHLDFGVVIGQRGEAHFDRVSGLRVVRLAES